MIHPEQEGSTQGYPLANVEVLRYDKRSKSENIGIVPTEMELILEHTQQGESGFRCPEYSYGRSPQPVLICCFCSLGRKEKLRTRCSSQASDFYFGVENASVSSVTPEGSADMTLKRQNKKRRVYMGIWSCFPKGERHVYGHVYELRKKWQRERWNG
nr:hypothetical protein [Tanacetum cinerariifolium]